jgi:hypothetical protein
VCSLGFRVAEFEDQTMRQANQHMPTRKDDLKVKAALIRAFLSCK